MGLEFGIPSYLTNCSFGGWCNVMKPVILDWGTKVTEPVLHTTIVLVKKVTHQKVPKFSYSGPMSWDYFDESQHLMQYGSWLSMEYYYSQYEWKPWSKLSVFVELINKVKILFLVFSHILAFLVLFVLYVLFVIFVLCLISVIFVATYLKMQQECVNPKMNNIKS